MHIIFRKCLYFPWISLLFVAILTMPMAEFTPKLYCIVHPRDQKDDNFKSSCLAHLIKHATRFRILNKLHNTGDMGCVFIANPCQGLYSDTARSFTKTQQSNNQFANNLCCQLCHCRKAFLKHLPRTISLVLKVLWCKFMMES